MVNPRNEGGRISWKIYLEIRGKMTAPRALTGHLREPVADKSRREKLVVRIEHAPECDWLEWPRDGGGYVR